MSNIENIIPASINPVKKNNYWTGDCPQCNTKGSLFIYENGYTAFCNRQNNCGYISRLWDIPGAHKAYEFKERATKKKPPEIKPVRNMTDAILPAMGTLDENAVRYLEKRIPGISFSNTLSELLAVKHIGRPRRLRGLGNIGNWLTKKGYELLTPLHNIITNKMVSGQARYTNPNGPSQLLRPNGDPLKVMSLPNCPYGEGGATFGSLQRAINCAESRAARNKDNVELPFIIVAEGDIDYITLRHCGFRNVVGVPGVSQAKNVARRLQDIDWRGILILSLDGDNAGEKSFNQVAKIIEGDNIILLNGRPPNCDINEAYNDWGGVEAIQRLIKNAKAKKGLRRDFNKVQKDKRMVELMRAKLWMTSQRLSSIAKDRIRVTVEGVENCPIKALARPANCGEYKEYEIFYKDGVDPLKVNQKTKVAETPSCPHCAATQWNLHICPYLRKHWPPEVFVLLTEFEKGNIEEAKAKKSEILRSASPHKDLIERGQEADNFFIIVDVVKSHLVSITGVDPEGKNDAILGALRSMGTLKRLKLDDALREYVMPAHMSYAEYIENAASDFERVLIRDAILTTKFERYTARDGLPWPLTADIKKGVRFVISERVKELKQELALGEGFSIYLTTRERLGVFKKILGISWQGISFDNLLKADVFGQSMNFDPNDPKAGNFLENPRLAPKPVKEIINDFFWIEYGRPALAEDFSKIVKFPTKKVKPREDFIPIGQMNDEQYIQMLLDWNDAGYDPNKYEFLPGTMHIKDFIKIRDKVPI